MVLQTNNQHSFSSASQLQFLVNSPKKQGNVWNVRKAPNERSPSFVNGQNSIAEKTIEKLKSVLQLRNLFSDKQTKLYSFMTKQVLREEVQDSILSVEARGKSARDMFLKQKICCEVNLWDKMTKLKFLNWDDLCRRVKLKDKTVEFQLKTMASLFSRLLVIARSDRDLDFQQAISEHEFNNINPMLINPDGNLLTCKNKSDLIHALEEQSECINVPESVEILPTKRFIVIDGMAVVQALIQIVTHETCKQLAKAYVKGIDTQLHTYTGGRVIFDNYHKQVSIKDDLRYVSITSEDFLVDDSTPIRDRKKFLASKTTKGSLTLFLADKVIKHCKTPVITVTRRDVLSNSFDIQPTVGVSTQKEADTLMMLHALDIKRQDCNSAVDFFTQDTDWNFDEEKLGILFDDMVQHILYSVVSLFSLESGTCDCPNTIPYTDVEHTELEVGDVTTVMCKDGYNAVVESSCHTSGTWTLNRLTCILRKNKLTCLNKIGALSCPAGQTMSIVSVFYGRLDKTTCISAGMYSTNCQDVTEAATYVETLCNGKNVCSVDARNFPTDPCLGTHKYHRIVYDCLAE
ncbi:hypothetical protein ScPMuIL_006401 [Solemya velum]